MITVITTVWLHVLLSCTVLLFCLAWCISRRHFSVNEAISASLLSLNQTVQNNNQVSQSVSWVVSVCVCFIASNCCCWAIAQYKFDRNSSVSVDNVLYDEQKFCPLSRNVHFRCVRIIAKNASYLRRVHLAVCPYISAWPPLDGFTWNLILRTFVKICREIRIFFKSDKKCRTLYLKIWGCVIVPGEELSPQKNECTICNVLYCQQCCGAQHYTQNVLLPFHCKDCYANASQCYVIRSLPILFQNQL